ncbi:DinB family protein [Sphingobacterium hungaricum]|uniref:Damage-inducible protein DinB n=1 Tax=Sphingobacterium hungaricum TaxID=2082723 RepID=A0A928YTI6_9SPHI|nr:DinB family protein [Sphingobacterium hungaricum]MBE8715198.1 damage-inducible protein DinB [Sphingobacterium hungaricum]
MSTQNVLSKEEILEHWLGHRRLTRRVIEAFPEKELFEYSIGGMRTFADLVKELISIDVPGLNGIVTKSMEPYNHNLDLHTKEDLLKEWDANTPELIDLYNQIPIERFHESFNLFGQYEFPVIHNIMYFIDNEIHHRGQGTVYLRSLGIEPPFFWER